MKLGWSQCPSLRHALRGMVAGVTNVLKDLNLASSLNCLRTRPFTMSGRVLLLLAVERLKGTGSFWAPPPGRDSSAAAVNDLIRLGL